MSSAPQPAPSDSTTASVQITIFTNSAAGRVTNITCDCFDVNGNVINTFQGLGPTSQNILGNVATGCPVTFFWDEQTNNPNQPVTCTEFKLFFANPNPDLPPGPGPFGPILTDYLFSTPLTWGGELLRATIINGNANWEYSGHLFVSFNSAAPVPLTFDPELEIENVG